MLSGGIITTLDAQNGAKNPGQKGERKKEKDATEWRLFHVTRGLLHQHHPRHRWVTEEAQSEAAAASPAEQTLLTAA